METLLLLTYGALCFAAFRIFNLPVNGYTVVTAVLGGVVMIAVIILAMSFNHPYTVLARTYFVTTPIVPTVGGRVIAVEAEAEAPLAPGDVLFRIDPEPYALRVAELEARLAQVEADIEQDAERVAAAEAAVEQARASLRLAQEQFDRDSQLVESGTIPEVRLDQRRTQLDVARGTLERAEADLALAREEQGAVTADGANAKRAEIEAQLARARWDLEQTTVRAPEDGYVTQIGLRAGFQAVPFPLKPAMVFVSERPGEVVASFRQVAAQRLEVGDEAEIAFFALPGEVFTGRVTRILDVMAAGEFAAGGTLVAPEQAEIGRITVLIALDEAALEHHLPGGSAGFAAVYTEHWEMFAIIRKILLRMKAWTFYLSFDH